MIRPTLILFILLSNACVADQVSDDEIPSVSVAWQHVDSVDLWDVSRSDRPDCGPQTQAVVDVFELSGTLERCRVERYRSPLGEADFVHARTTSGSGTILRTPWDDLPISYDDLRPRDRTAHFALYAATDPATFGLNAERLGIPDTGRRSFGQFAFRAGQRLCLQNVRPVLESTGRSFAWRYDIDRTTCDLASEEDGDCIPPMDGLPGIHTVAAPSVTIATVEVTGTIRGPISGFPLAETTIDVSDLMVTIVR